ncbi:hypothetical protein C0Q70_19117 [Pomacea canaliculata]|uniref:Uncharacterized protein n=1 Tax=Pomacea canaliculata TaxID=400727 RepID=A0A2T7NIG3_POMCA|nr:hypothetical protein C0Q70_19117 [Pomacea canaliculata]
MLGDVTGESGVRIARIGTLDNYPVSPRELTDDGWEVFRQHARHGVTQRDTLPGNSWTTAVWKLLLLFFLLSIILDESKLRHFLRMSGFQSRRIFIFTPPSPSIFRVVDK